MEAMKMNGNGNGNGNGTHGFEELALHPKLMRAIEELGFEKPTPVQRDAMPPALDGRDVLACAMTGSGKTAAFVLPILQRLLDEPGRGTRALVLTPTRELAAQVADHLAELAAHTDVRVATVFGGVGAGPQESAFRKGVAVIVGTPGRLLDHFQHDYAKLSGLEVLVFDEADRMLDMGFLPDIKRILRHLPKTPRQTLFFSATMPKEIVALSRDILRDPVRISVERKSAPARGIVQALYPVGSQLKVDLLARLLDHFQHDYAKLSGLEVLVFDEADRMLDMGFLPDIKRILRHLPKAPRQTLFFSATMPEDIVRLSRDILRDPVRISVERKSAPAKGVVQALYPVGSQLKVELLARLLERGEIGNAIVFCRTKHRADRVAKKLAARGITAGRIHGNRSQGQRTAALAAFKNGQTRVLVATDIVARGIDVEALDHVVNFDVPHTPDDYIHRVGRTARAEMTGDAYTLVSPEEEPTIRAIERALGRTIERRTVGGFDYQAPAESRLEAPGRERAPRNQHARRAPRRLSPR
ncbi:MAG TPA: DEAD/DEAH box helicase [Gemmatimonadota bacterium]|nr:DEAD/DEAH box helicase [Gemmatimonadota bacterium]